MQKGLKDKVNEFLLYMEECNRMQHTCEVLKAHILARVVDLET